MINRIIRFVVTQRVFVLLFGAAAALVGVMAFVDLPVEAFPDVQDVQVQVITLSNGQAPEDVERSVTLPIERALAGTPRLTNLRSVTMSGLSLVTATFSDRTSDYFARQQVLERLQNVTLPTGVQPQLGPLSTAIGEVYRYALESTSVPPRQLRTLQDWTLRPALLMTPGVADVVSFGGAIKEYQVDIDPSALAKYQVTLDQVTQALSTASASVGGATVRRGSESIVVRSAGLFASVDDIRDVAISARAGRPILVGDVASVHVGDRPRFGVVSFDRDDDVTEGIVLMVKGSDPAKVNAALKSRIAQITPRLPTDVRIVPIYDRTVLVHHTTRTVAENLVTGALLVIAVLIVFLTNWRAALIVAAVIPCALLFAFLLMQWAGVSANLISLGAVDFGILVDGAVVIVEALMVRMALSAQFTTSLEERYGAIFETYRKMTHPVLFAKAVIVLAFVPIFTFERVEGKIFTPVALTLSFALAGAVLATFTLVPTLLSYAVGRRPMVEKPRGWMAWLRQRYEGLLRRMFSRPVATAVVSVIALVTTAGIAHRLGSEFLPKLDEGNIWLTVTLPTSASLELTKSVERDLRKRLLSFPEVAHVISQAGRPDDGSDPKGANSIEILVDLHPRSTWRVHSKEQLIAQMSSDLHGVPGIDTNFSQVIEDNVEEALSGSKGEIVVKITGDDLQVLDRKGVQVAALLRSITGASDVDTTHVGGQTELIVTPDRSRLARLGVSIGDVNAVVTQALSGVSVNSFYESDRRFDVVGRVLPIGGMSPDRISELQLVVPGATNGNGPATVPLSDVARIEIRQGASRILHESGARTVIVKVNVVGRDQGSFVDEARARVAEQVALPAGYRLEWGGQFENSERATRRLYGIVPITIASIFCLLFWAFRSLAVASIVMATVPFTALGGVAALALAGLHLSISAAVGFIAVAGICVQSGVILVEESLARATGRTGSVDDALIDAARERLRPILMTALMAGLGLLPAALSTGIGSETQRPFACVIVGGVVTGTLATLFLLPLALQFLCRRGSHLIGVSQAVRTVATMGDAR